MSYWHKLLHYRSTTFGRIESEVDDKNFFVSNKGKYSPDSELENFIEALNSNKAQSVVCKYPLRYKWISSVIKNNWKYTTENCEIYNSFIQKLSAKNLSLVFSSYYTNNPASTFGHTFIRVSRYREFNANEMLDNAFNFSAEKSQDHVFKYMIKGLTGFYKGQFSSVPYYYKIHEYNNFEFRDLWDFNLNLSQEQIDRVVDHIWELGDAHFDYFYFTENCSYHILGLLNVAYDKIDIQKDLNHFFILPLDTIKAMKNMGLIQERKFRPSVYRKLVTETEGLTKNELKTVKELAKNPNQKNKSKIYSAKILDASITAFDYLNAEKVLLGDKKVNELRSHLLIQRAEHPDISKELIFYQKKIGPPDEGHDPSRIGLFAGDRYRQGSYTGFEWRAAQHDLLDPSLGHLKTSQVVIFDTKFRFQTVNYASNKLVLDRFRFFDLKKYQPSNFWNQSTSFDFALGLDQKRSCLSQNCLNPILTYGAGNTIELGDDFNLSLLLGGSYQFKSLINLGPKVNFLILKENYSLGLDASYYLPNEVFEGWLKRVISYDLDLRFHLWPNRDLFFKTTHIDHDVWSEHEAHFGIYFYH
jgi:hypothetical protein